MEKNREERNKKRMLGMCISLVLAVLVLASYPREASAVEGVKTVKVGLGMALTGPQPAVSIPLSYGYMDHYRWINEELGGIEVGGARYKFDVMWEDTGYTPVRAISLYKKFKGAGVKYVQFIGSHPNEAISAMTSADRIPDIGANANLSPVFLKTQPNYTSTVISPYVDYFSGAMDWIKENWKETRKPKVGVIALDISWGRMLDRGYGAPEYAEKVGIDWVGIEFVPFTVTDATVQVIRMAGKNPDFIWVQHLNEGVATVLKDAKRLGVLKKMKWMWHPGGLTESFLTLAGEVAEGGYGVAPFPLPQDKGHKIDEARRAFLKYRGKSQLHLFDGYYMEAWACAEVAIQAIRIAIRDYGYNNLTGPNILESVFKIKDYDMGGLTATLTMNRDYPSIMKALKMYRVEGGKFKAVSDWRSVPRVLKFQ